MITIYTILVFGAIFMQAFFAASEMAFTSVNRIKLKSLVESGDSQATKLDAFLHQESGYLGSTLVGTNIAVVIASALATRIFAEYFGAAFAPLLATVIMVPLTLIFAEIIPKMISRQFATEFALRAQSALGGFNRLFHPVIVSVNTVAKLILIPFGRGRASWDVTFTKSDIKKIVILGHETGEVEADEVELIHKVLDFGAKKVESIMVPMYRVSSISIDDTTDDLKKLVSLTGFSRIPVYDKNKNNIAGIVNIYDILFQMEEEAAKTAVSDFLREAVYVNRKDSLDIALARLRHRKQPMGIVTEEDNKVVGIVTIEDILEEIVGEIEDTGTRI
ncbi:MAG: hemolysin family protein [Candidatus Omnitrophota bacterium]